MSSNKTIKIEMITTGKEITNEEKAREIAKQNTREYLPQNPGFSMDECEKSALEMAQWKDQQFKEYLEKKKERLAAIERDPRSGMEYRIWHETNLLNEIINELFPESEELDNSDNDESIFENAKFGDKFITDDGKLGIFLNKDCHHAQLIYEDGARVFLNNSGREQEGKENEYDIVGKWEEPIDKSKERPSKNTTRDIEKLS